MATFYFNAAVDNDWNNLNNWWMTFDGSTYSNQATSLPTSSDDVIINANCASNTGSEPTVNNLTVNGNTVFNGFTIIVIGIADFNDTSSVGTGSFDGTDIYGIIKFYDYSYNNYDCPGNNKIGNSVQIEFHDYSYNDRVVCGDQANATKFFDSSYNASPIGFIYFSIFYNNAHNNSGTKGATFYDNSYNGSTGMVECTSGGEAIFHNSSYNDGIIAPYGGNAIFKDQSVNKRGISGTIILDYPKGINGSSILGLV